MHVNEDSVYEQLLMIVVQLSALIVNTVCRWIKIKKNPDHTQLIVCENVRLVQFSQKFHILTLHCLCFQVNVATQCDPDEIIVLSDSE